MSAESASVILFAAYMFDKFDLVARNKEDSFLMKIIAWFLHYTRIMDKKVFMENYTTTMFGVVYLNYTIGDFSQMSFANQMAMIVHECYHRLQAKENIPFFWRLYYLFSNKKRTEYEMKAYGGTLKTKYWLTGQIGDPVYYAKKLESYRCGEYIDMATKYLKKVVDLIDDESYYNEIDFAAKKWIQNEM